MARKPRIEISGYYHIVNRGVEQRVVFVDKDDFETFENMMCTYAQMFGIQIHNYTLMNNHYHLLVEINKPTLSKYMRALNMNYAIYFNKRYKRSGHLWQGRFKSWYVSNEAYFYMLMRYIEQNPIKAHLVKDISLYPYSSSRHFLGNKSIPYCLQDSWIAKHFNSDQASIKAFLGYPVDSTDLQELRKSSSLVEAPNIQTRPNEKMLQKRFENIEDKQERNRIIAQAYKDGYSQHMIAKVLGLNQATIQRIIKRTKI